MKYESTSVFIENTKVTQYNSSISLEEMKGRLGISIREITLLRIDS